MDKVSFTVNDFGYKEHDNVIYVYKPFIQNTVVSFVGWLYNRLFLLNMAYMLKAKVCFPGCEIELSENEFQYKMMVSSYDECHRVVFFEEKHMDYLKEYIEYNPYLWDVSKCKRMSEVFKYYFDAMIPINNMKGKKILGIYIERFFTSGGLIEHRKLIEKYCEKIEKIILENQTDYIFIHDCEGVLKDFITYREGITVYNLSDDTESSCLLKFFWSNYYIGTASPFTYLLNAIKESKERSFEIMEVIEPVRESMMETKVYAIDKLYGKRGVEAAYDQFLLCRDNNDKNACFCKFMGKLAKIYAEDDSLLKRLIRKKIYRIAVYGAGIIGTFLYKDLLDGEGITVEYFVDKNVDSLSNYTIENLENFSLRNYIDAIVVTPLFYFDEIYFELREIGVTVPILPIEMIVYDINDEL